MARYLILGAGAVGGGIGARLVAAGSTVVLVARGDHLNAMRTSGLRLRTPTEDLRLPVDAVGGPAEVALTTDDVLVVTVKTHQLPALLTDWVDQPVVATDGTAKGTAGEQLPVLTAMNGVVSETMALRYFDRVYGVCVWMPAVHLVPGEVIIRSTPAAGVFHVGRVPAGPSAGPDDHLLARIAADWQRARLNLHRPEYVMAWKYRKLITNVGNAVQALLAAGEPIDDLVAAAEREAREILDAATIPYVGDAEEAAARASSFVIRPVAGAPEEMGGSSWQSLARNTGTIETDYLNGEVALIARQHGGSAPINAALAALARRAAATGSPPGALTADDLWRRIGR